MNFDPRDIDSRDDERYGLDRDRGHRHGSEDARDWDDWRQHDSRDRDDDTRELGRGPGDSRHDGADKHGHDPRDDTRGLERDRA